MTRKGTCRPQLLAPLMLTVFLCQWAGCASAPSGAEVNATENRLVACLLATNNSAERFTVKPPGLDFSTKDAYGRPTSQKATVRLVQPGDTKGDIDLGRIAVIGQYWEEDGPLWMPAGSVFAVSKTPSLVYIKKRPADTIYGYKGVARTLKEDEVLSSFLPMVPGSVHRFIGDIPLAGCLFRGEAHDPLSFAVIPSVGYVYLHGKGSVVLHDGGIVEIAADGTTRQAGTASAEVMAKIRQTKEVAVAPPHVAATNLPPFKLQLRGSREVRVRNPNDFAVAVGVRSGDSGRDFEVSANGVNSVFVPDGHYDIYFIYSDKPDALFQGDSFTLRNNGVEIQIVKVVNGNYGIRQVK